MMLGGEIETVRNGIYDLTYSNKLANDAVKSILRYPEVGPMLYSVLL